MIPAPLPSRQPARWQQAWRDAVRDPRELLALLGLGTLADAIPDGPASPLPTRTEPFPLRVPRASVVLADHAVHCRYCFRRHFPYAEETAAAEGWQEAVAAIAADDTIDEVILSGGDPLSLATHKLDELTSALAGVPHLRRLRIHTRLPVVLPERVDDALVEWLAALPWPVTVVLHANHANEFDSTVDAAAARLRDAGATLLNQAVLLRGVNDTVEALAALSERGFEAGVLPYYLHQLDRVQGAAHFEVADDEARRLHAALAARLSGYLVPRLVREVAGDPGKRPISP